jgi:ABC-type sugar transport system permease subunit
MTAIAARHGGVRRVSAPDRGGRFVVPLVAIMALTSVYPTFYSLWFSLFDWNWGQRFNFVGLSNYVELAGS